MRQALATSPSASQVSLATSHFSLQPDRATRPLSLFHPTRAEFQKHSSAGASQPAASRWSSRASRKNRYSSNAIRVRRQHDVENGIPEKAPSAKQSVILVQQRLRHPHTHFKVHLSWDVSFWVAVTFVLGSAAWVSSFPPTSLSQYRRLNPYCRSPMALFCTYRCHLPLYRTIRRRQQRRRSWGARFSRLAAISCMSKASTQATRSCSGKSS